MWTEKAKQLWLIVEFQYQIFPYLSWKKKSLKTYSIFDCDDGSRIGNQFELKKFGTYRLQQHLHS